MAQSESSSGPPEPRASGRSDAAARNDEDALWRDPSEAFDELDDWARDLLDAAVPGFNRKSPEREGLPPGFKLRHTSHYVEELTSAETLRQVIRVPVSEIQAVDTGRAPLQALTQSISGLGVLQPLLVRRRQGSFAVIAGAKRLAAAKLAGLTEVPCVLYDVNDEQASRLREASNLKRGPAPTLATATLPHLGQSLQTIVSCLNVVGDGNEDLVSLLKAEVHRASRLTQAASLLSTRPRTSFAEIDVSEVIDEVLRRSEDERRLSGVELRPAIERPLPTMADRRLLAIGFSGALETVLALARIRRGSQLGVRLRQASRSSGCLLEMSQNVWRLPPTEEAGSWLDLSWRERPGGFAAGVGLLAAKRVAELHGGRLQLGPLTGGGGQLTLEWQSAGRPPTGPI